MFKFDLMQIVTIEESGETGTVVARAEYLDSKPQYQVRYKRADGTAGETWWAESALINFN